MKSATLTRIKEVINAYYLGFAPTSNSTKPPHIANGLFRHCMGETCDTRDIHEWVFEKNAKRSTPSEEILSKYEELFQNGCNEKTSNIKEFRFLLEDIFNQDNGAYAGATNYSYSVMTILPAMRSKPSRIVCLQESHEISVSSGYITSVLFRFSLSDGKAMIGLTRFVISSSSFSSAS